MYSTNNILFDKTNEQMVNIEKALSIKKINVKNIKGISFNKNHRFFKLSLIKTNIKDNSNGFNTYIPQDTIGEFENISFYVVQNTYKDSKEAKHSFAHSFFNFSTLGFLLNDLVYAKKVFINEACFIKSKETPSAEFTYLNTVLTRSIHQVAKNIYIGQFNLKTIERSLPYSIAYKIPSLNRLNPSHSKDGFAFIDAFSYRRQQSRINTNSNDFVYEYSFRAPIHKIKNKSIFFKRINSRYRAINPRKLIFNKQKRLIR